MRAVRFLAAMLSLLAAGTVSAVEPMSCRNGGFMSRPELVSAGRIIDAAGPRVHLYNDDEGCPEAETCRQKAYLVPGDEVLVAQRDGAWVCVWYFGKRREYVGWLPAGTVAFAPKTTPALEDWVGTWKPIGGENKNARRLALGHLIGFGPGRVKSVKPGIGKPVRLLVGTAYLH